MTYTGLINAESNGTIVLGTMFKNLIPDFCIFYPFFLPNLNVGLTLAISLPQTTYAITLEPGLGELTCRYVACTYGTPDTTCNSSLDCVNCNNGIVTTRNGITTTTTGTWTAINCPTYNTTATYSCACRDQNTTHKCASGYYGTATSSSAGCTACPSNATCAGGNGSTFVCAKGYYKDGTSCSPCPSSDGIAGTTASTGATSITSCYLPSGSTRAFSDTNGSGTETISSNCYYSN